MTAAAKHLALVHAVEATEPPPVGSEEWASEIRERAKKTAADLESGYMRMGELLHLARTKAPSGAPVHAAYWGYLDYDRWVESELGLMARKARSLCRIYERLVIDLSALDDGLRRRIVGLGWTKVREVVRVLTLENAQRWAELGEVTPYPDFRAAVSKYADDLIQAQIAASKNHAQTAGGAAGGTAGGTALRDAAPSNLAEDDSDEELPQGDALGADFADTPEPPEALPQPEVTVPFNFALYPEQAEVMRAALKMAEEINPKKPKSLHLTTMADEYLATYVPGTTPEERRVAVLVRIAERFGLTVAVARPDGTPLYPQREQGRLERYADYNEVKDYPQISTALDNRADDHR